MTSTLKSILLTMAAMAVFATLDASAKFVNQSLPMQVAVFFRYGIALLVTTLVLWRYGGWTLLSSRHPVLQVLRGVFLLSSTFSNFFAMHYLQLAEVAAISFTIPLWVCALSVPLLGEKVGLRRWLAVLVGFCGVLVVMRPGTDSFHWAMLVSLVTALLGALYNLTTRKVSGSDNANTSLLYVCLVGTLGATGPMLANWQTPEGMQWLPLIIMGVAGAIGHFMLIEAHRLSPASTIAPFIYSQIVWMILAGYLVFGQFPDGWTLVGAGIVVASGAYVFNRERRRGVTTNVVNTAD